MVAEVASDEPQTALKPPQAAMVAVARPPRVWPSQALDASYRSFEMRDWAMKLPIMIKSGSTANSAFRIWPKASVPTDAIAGAKSRKWTSPRKPIKAMPKAIGTSRKSRMKSAMKAMATSSIAYDPELDDRSV